MRKFNFIYKTTNLINRKIYIGQHITDNLEDNYIGCGLDNPNYIAGTSIFQRAVKKYGFENFRREILEFVEKVEELSEREKFWIREHNSMNLEIGYNMTKGGDGGDTFTNNPNKELIRKRFSEIQRNQSEETKKKRADSHRGMKRPEETGKKISIANKDRVITTETRLKISITLSGRIQTKESVEKRSRANKEKTRSVETCKRISEGRNGIVFSPEHIENLKTSHTGKRQSIETIEKKKHSLIGKNVGKVRTQEMKDRWSRSHTGKILSKESIEKRTKTRRENFEKKQLLNQK